MGKATSIHLIVGKEPLRKVVTCSVEFDRGSLYYDRAGRLLRRWEKLFPGWTDPTVTPAQVTSINIEQGWLGGFRPTGASLTLSVEATGQTIDETVLAVFAAGIQGLLGELVDEFELDRFNQLGYKETYHFPADSNDDSSQWIRKLGISPIPSALFAAFGQNYHAQTMAIVTYSDHCRYRIEAKGMESHAVIPFGVGEVSFQESGAIRRASNQDKELLSKLKMKRERQLNPKFFGHVDLEAFLWDGVAADFEIADFVLRHSSELLPKFRTCVSQTEIRDV